MNKTEQIIMPGQWLGMLGGGQLGRMFCHSAQSMGYKVAVLDPDPESPAGAVADKHIQCDYTDSAGLQQLSALCAAVSTEFENIPVSSLTELQGKIITRPAANALAVTQNRNYEKSFFVETGVPVAPHIAVHSPNCLTNAPDSLFPGILKSARFGYDGKGQIRVQNLQEGLDAFAELGKQECILEALQPLEFEVSVVLARDSLGNVAAYNPVKNEHRDGILAVSTSNALSDNQALQQQAVNIATSIAQSLNYIGVLCVEFFVLADGRLVVNEIAPRPHNSGHYTINASVCSQFEQQVRVLAGLPLGDCTNLNPCIMLNLLGNVWFKNGNANPVEPNWHEVLAVKGVHLHLYGKSSVRAGRKMGHINIVGNTYEEAHQAAAAVANILGITF